jgi:hypothetical protein
LNKFAPSPKLWQSFPQPWSNKMATSMIVTELKAQTKPPQRHFLAIQGALMHKARNTIITAICIGGFSSGRKNYNLMVIKMVLILS